jgi:hypothetical protein
MKDKKTLWAVIIWWALFCISMMFLTVENYQDGSYLPACIDSGCFGAGLYMFFDCIIDLVRLIRAK